MIYKVIPLKQNQNNAEDREKFVFIYKIKNFKVKIAAIQNAIVLPTTAPVIEQREAIHKRVGSMIEVAGQAGAKIVCLQEAWSN